MNEFESIFRNISECEHAYCRYTRLGNTHCKRHGGLGKRCVGVKRDGDQCNNYANDCGEKCDIHGGFSERDIGLLNSYLSTRIVTPESPLVVKNYDRCLMDRRLGRKMSREDGMREAKRVFEELFGS